MTSATQSLTRARPKEQRTARRRSRDPRSSGIALVFTAPFFIVFVLFLFWPVLSALRTSLFDESLVGGASWTGLNARNWRLFIAFRARLSQPPTALPVGGTDG